MVTALKHPDRVQNLCVVDIAPAQYRIEAESPFVSVTAIINAIARCDLSVASTRSDVDKQLQSVVREASTRSFIVQNLVPDPTQPNRLKWRLNVDAILRHLPSIASFPVQSSSVYNNGPCIFIAGARSKYIGPQHYADMARLFPTSKLVQIERAGHWVHMDDPNAFTTAIGEFYKECGDRA